MKWLLFIAAVATIACSSGIASKPAANDKEIIEVRASTLSFAVLELFTSEGCSSCPPADRLLPQLTTLDSNVIPLSFHVDYWNHLGWTDPFSKAEFSERQRHYAERFHLESIYTPQLVINGEYELVGSSRSLAEADIKKALKEKSAVTIQIDEVKKAGASLSVGCHLEGDWKQTNITAVLVQKHAEVNVKAGENGGVHLSHTNVARSFNQMPAHQKLSFEMEIPTDLAGENSRLIIYAQQKNLKITGVAVYDRF